MISRLIVLAVLLSINTSYSSPLMFCSDAEKEIMANMLSQEFFRVQGINVYGLEYTFNAVEFRNDESRVEFFGTVNDQRKWHVEQLLKDKGVKFTACILRDQRRSAGKDDDALTTQELGWSFYTRKVIFSQ